MDNPAERAMELARVLSSGTPSEAAAALVEANDLFASYQDRIYGLCLRMVHDPEQARELAQDTLMTAYIRLPTYRGESRFDTWLLGIARNLGLNARRKKGEALSADGVIDATDPASSALTRLRRQEREDLLRDAAAAVLDPDEQEAIHLRYIEHLPLASIDELLGLESASGTRGLLQRCKRKLGKEIRRRLAEMGHGSSFVRGTLE